MNLRPSESFWLLKNGIINSYPSLKENIACDIAVVGSGITGALISYALHNAGFETVMLDKRDVATGSTAATTAMLQYEIDTPLRKLAEMIGENAAVECFRAGIRSIEILESIVKDCEIDCDFQRKQSLQVAHIKSAVSEMEEEFRLRKKHGFDVQWLVSRNLRKKYKMESLPGILSDQGASLDAYRFAHALIARTHANGMPVFDHTYIRKIRYDRNRIEITSEDGFRIFCKRIVYCTGFETLAMFRKKYADTISTFACVSEQNINLHNELKELLVWDAANPCICLRTTDDGRLLASGEDIPHKYSQLSEKLKDRKAERLAKKVRKLFPDIDFKEDYNWAGTFAVTKDGLPYIGEHPDFPGAVFVLGSGKNGIAFSVQGMELVLKILAKQSDTLLHHYRFDR